MGTWTMVLLFLSAITGAPSAVTLVPGFATRLECQVAGQMHDGLLSAFMVQTQCVQQRNSKIAEVSRAARVTIADLVHPDQPGRPLTRR